MSKSSLQQGFAALGIVMVVATVTLVGFVAFRFLDAQDNTEVARDNSTQVSQVPTIRSTADVDTVTEELDAAELDSLDAELDAEFAF